MKPAKPGAAAFQSKPFRHALMRAPCLGWRIFNQDHFATRCALAGELLFSVAKKVTKNALYRQQRTAVQVEGVGGLVFDNGVGERSSCPFVMFRFGSRVTMRFRLRWLSERGRGDRDY